MTLAGSYEDVGQRVVDMVTEGGTFGEAMVYNYATFPDHVVFVVSKGGSDAYYRANFAVADGAVALGDITEVELTTTATEKAAAEEAPHLLTVERLSAELKAGRVLSQKNLDALDAAINELQRIRKAAMGTDAGGSEEKNDANSKAADAPREQRLERALRDQTLLTLMEV
jgi:hypothetical protein